MKNLDILGGLVFSEGVMMRLSREFGRLEAHEMVYDLAQKAIGENLKFRELLLADPKVSAAISAEEPESIIRYEDHIGLSEYFVDIVAGK